MSSVTWTLNEGWEDDLVDLMGTVTVVGTSGGEIVEDDVNIDFFLERLLRVVSLVCRREGNHAEIDLVMEPEKFSANRLPNNGMSLSYGKQTVQIDNLRSFRDVLVDSTNEFLRVLPEDARSESETIESLEQLLT